jgi:adenosylmethionine-8-amino-7-oxononanoate aminotransferase
MQHDEKLGTGLIHHVVPQRRLAMQHAKKLGTMKLIMLSSEEGYHGTTIVILILVGCSAGEPPLNFSCF